jgi:hypothetical protein
VCPSVWATEPGFNDSSFAPKSTAPSRPVIACFIFHFLLEKSMPASIHHYLTPLRFYKFRQEICLNLDHQGP